MVFAIDPPIELGREDTPGPVALAALGEVAATLRANPKLGHASIVLGTKGAKPAVTEKRTQQILRAMAASKLESTRYNVVQRDNVRSGLVEVKLEP